jgi:excisionase family DNA binding protein
LRARRAERSKRGQTPRVPHDELLTIPEAARRLRVEPGTLRRWISEGRVPAIRLAGQRGPLRVVAADLVLLFEPARPRPDGSVRP